MIKNIRVDGVELEKTTLEYINKAMLQYKENIAGEKDVQVALKKIKERKEIFNQAFV